MKYSAPKYNVDIIEAEDILTLSFENYKIENKGDGSGNVIVTANDLFGI